MFLLLFCKCYNETHGRIWETAKGKSLNQICNNNQILPAKCVWLSRLIVLLLLPWHEKPHRNRPGLQKLLSLVSFMQGSKLHSHTQIWEKWAGATWTYSSFYSSATGAQDDLGASTFPLERWKWLSLQCWGALGTPSPSDSQPSSTARITTMGFRFAVLSHLQPDSKPDLAHDKLKAHLPS